MSFYVGLKNNIIKASLKNEYSLITKYIEIHRNSNR